MKILLLFFLSLSISITCIAQWTKCSGPSGGVVTFIAENKPTNSLFAGTKSSGIFRFQKSFGYWENLSIQLPLTSIREIGVLDSIVFAAAYYDSYSWRGLYKSNDNGNTWDEVIIDSTVTIRGVNNIYCNDSLIIISSYSNIYISNDKGISFNEIGHNLPDSTTTIYDLLIKGNRIFAIYKSDNFNSTISYSDNFGQSWQKPISPIGWINDCKGLRTFSNKLYALSVSHLKVSDDFGITWDSLPTPGIPTGAAISDLFISNDSILVGTYSKGIYLSTDSGVTFNLVYSGLPSQSTYSNQFFRSSSNGLLVATKMGIYNSINRGSTWGDFNERLTATNNYSLTFCNNELFVSSQIHGVFGTKDYGNTWLRKSSGLESNSGFQNNIVITSIGNRLILGTSNEVYISDNNGNTWTHITNGIPANEVGRFEYNNGRLYAGTGYGVCYSDDTATTWHKLSSFPSCQTTAIYVQDSLIIGTIICLSVTPPYSTQQIRRSVNYGYSFTTVDTILNLYDIEKIDTLFLGTNFGRYLSISNDGGINWRQDTTFGNQRITDVHIVDSRFIILGTDGGKIFISTDFSLTWTDITENFQGVATQFLSVGHFLFVTTSNSGVWKKNIYSLINENVNLNYGFMLFPNPTQDIFNFTIPKELKANRNLVLSIYNSIGKLMKTISLDSDQEDYNISMRNIPSGLYYVLLDGEGIHYSSKIVHVN